jgi:hypothetical protein
LIQPDLLDSSLGIPVCSILLALPRLAHALLDCSHRSVLAHLWPVPILDSSPMMSMVLRWPDHFLESILRLVFLCRHWLVQFHGCSRLLVLRLNLLDLFLEVLVQQYRLWFLPVPFLESACRACGVWFLPVHCLPWLVACLVSSQPNPRLELQLAWSECYPLVELLLGPNPTTPKVLARQSRVLVQVLQQYLNLALFPCLELHLVNLQLLVTHPFLGSRPSRLRVQLGVPSRALRQKLLVQLALLVQPQGLKEEPSRWPV